MSFAGNTLADLFEMQLHGLSIGCWQNQSGTGAAFWADGAEQISILITLVCWQSRAGAFLCPDAHPPVLLPDPRFVLEPNLYRFSFW